MRITGGRLTYYSILRFFSWTLTTACLRFTYSTKLHFPTYHGAPEAHVAQGADGAYAAPVKLYAAPDTVSAAPEHHHASSVALH